MSDDFYSNRGEDYYEYINKEDRPVYMWKEDGKKYKKVYNEELGEYIWELVEK